MKTVRRGIRSIIRSPMRTGLLVAVLGVSVGLTLIMITVNAAFSERLDEIRAEVGTDVTIQPAGSFGGGFFRGSFQGPAGGSGAPGGEGAPGSDEPVEATTLSDTLADGDIDALWSIDHVTSVARTITVPYSGDGLASGFQPPEGAPAGAGGFTRPVLVTGTDTPNALMTIGVGDLELIAGRTFNDDEAEANVAVIGSTLAEANGLDVGDTFQMNEAGFEVVGIFTSGTQFGDNSAFLPLATAQAVFEREDEIDQAVVRAESVDHVAGVAADIRVLLGEDIVDVSTQESLFTNISAPLADAKDSSRIAMIAALVASAAVILFSVALVARQRVKEIGILKSIGASNWHVTAQFGIETAVVSVVAALLGALATFPLAQSVANGLVADPAAPQGPGGFGRAAGGQIARGGGQFQAAGGLLGDIDVAVSPEVFLYALGIAVVLAIVASIVPAWYVGRVKPAEVLRYE